MIEKIGGYRRYRCKKCREGNHWVWSWNCIKTPKIGRRYRSDHERGYLSDHTTYNYNGTLRKKEKRSTKNVLALAEYKTPYSKLGKDEKADVDEIYNGETETINDQFSLGPAVPLPGNDLIVGKDRYWANLSESLNVDERNLGYNGASAIDDCIKCGYGIAYCEPHWKVTKEHYGNTAYNSNFYHPWCYKQ